HKCLLSSHPVWPSYTNFLTLPEAHSGGYSYTTFCDRYRAWLSKRGLSRRQTHHAGEKAFIDYSGKKPSYWDRATGRRVEVELFVAVLGASNLTFVEATHTQ